MSERSSADVAREAAKATWGFHSTILDDELRRAREEASR